MDTTRKLNMRSKLGYGVGDAGANFCWTFVASFFLLYCTNVLGVSAAAVGTLLMISKIFDGISDVFMGAIIDRTRSKMGKARFWFFWSSFPVAFCVYLLFNIPAGFSETTKYGYIFVVYTLMGAVFYTMNNIAYSTLTALVTKDPKERVELGSYRFIFAIGAALVIMSITSPLVEALGGGQAGWRAVSIIYAILCLALLQISVWSVRELPESELQDQQVKEKKEKVSLLTTVKLLFQNKFFLLILLYYLSSYLLNGIYSGLGIYFATYNLGNGSLLGVLSIVSLLPTIIMLPLVPKITSKKGMRNTALIGMVIACIGGIIAFVGGSAQIIPLLFAGALVFSAGKAPMTGVTNALIAAADDYSELKYKQRITGAIYSCSSVGMKVGTGIGTALTGFILEFGKFDGAKAIQSEGTLRLISNSYAT
ncbi:MAG: glycoside-pentoside-hexuronide (GPH):cation symporter [Eubacteriales bacterium]|nr:glycoside-pentoside-hexuronide (GPH):cation symporter [Eubacteriales bacterium]